MAGIAAMGITVTYAGVPLVATSFNVNTIERSGKS